MIENNGFQVKSRIPLNKGWKIAGSLPVAIFFIMMVILSIQKSTNSYESPLLLAILNTVFLSIIPLFISLLGAKSYQTYGVSAFLWIGLGLFIFGLSSFFAGWVMPVTGDPNSTVTIHNLGSFFAGLCQFMAAHFFLQELAGISKINTKTRRYGIYYLVSFILITITVLFTIAGKLPAFYDPITGPSPLRQLILVGAVFMFVVGGLVFLEFSKIVKTEFAYWYGLALFLIAIGLICVFYQLSVGSTLGWIGRGVQYLGSVYIGISFFRGQIELPEKDLSAVGDKSWIFWPFLENKINERTTQLVKMNEILNLEILNQKKMEIIQQESEEKIRNLFNNAKVGIFRTRMNSSEVLDINEQTLDIFERTIGEMQSFDSDIHWADPLERQEMLHLLETEGSIRGFECKILTKNKKIRNCLTSAVLNREDGILEGSIIDITDRKQMEQALTQSNEQLRTLSVYLQNAIETERSHIAREIHDEFGQYLTALKMDLAWLAKRIPKGDKELERIDEMTMMIDNSISLIRRIASSLRPGMLDDLGLVSAIQWLANGFSERTGIPCELDLPQEDLHLDPSLSTALFRIFQESLTNVARHAQATLITVLLQKEDETIILAIKDNGHGITESESGNQRSFGLLGLRERAAQWGGDLLIQGVEGEGTTVIARIPLPNSDNEGG